MPKSNHGFYTIRKRDGDVYYLLWSDYDDYKRGLGPEHVVKNPEENDGAHLILCLQDGDFDEQN